MDEPSTVIGEHLRRRKQAIVDAWVARASELPSVGQLPHAALLDHLPEFLDGLADWMDGDEPAAQRAFDVLAEGHAIQRLGFGVELEVVTTEYALLRSIILRDFLSVATTPDIRVPLVRFNEAMDQAIAQAVRRFTEQRDHVRDRFVGILGHDLRTPLAAVAMGAATLVSSPDAAARRTGAMIGRSADRMSRMIEAVLDFTRAKLGGGIPANPTRVDMAELCAMAVEEVRAAHPERRLDLRTSGDLRGSWDPDRVLQALSNLIGNAVEHGRAPVVVTAREEDGRRAVITSVTNAGDVIPAEHLPALFDAFRGSHEHGHSGLGLGLYIVQQIAVAHGAVCSVESTASEGTTFSIRWPRVPLDEVPHRA